MSPTVTQVASWLQRLPELAELLPTALVVRPPSDPNAITTGSMIHSPVPLNVHAMALLDQRTRNLAMEMAFVDPDASGVQPYLRGWVIDIASDLLDAFPDGEPEPDSEGVAASCEWLLRHLVFAAILPQWPEFAAGVEHTFRAVDVATRHLRAGARTRSVSCGTCKRGRLRIAATQRDLLGYVVRARVGRVVPIWLLLAIACAPTEHGWTCDHCGRFAFVRPVTLPQAAAITHHPLRTLQHWAKHGRFTKVEALGVKLYDLGEVLAEVARFKVRTLLDAPELPDVVARS